MPRAAAKEQPTKRRPTAKEEPVAKRSRGAKTIIEQEKPTRSRRKAEVEEPAPTTRGRRKTTVEAPAPTGRTRKARATEVEEPVAKKTRRATKEETPEPEVAGFDPYANIDATLDLIEKKAGISENTLDKSEGRMSSGNLCLDIVLGGGYTAGWYTNFGQEQCCKTTEAVSVLVSALNHNVPIIAYYDFEGSASPEYIENIMRNMGVKADVKSIFGVKDREGNYIVRPRVRYRSEAIAEKFFDFVAGLERKLPDKKKIGDQWFYIYENTKENQKMLSGKYDKSYFSKTNLFRVPAPDGSPQAVILVDSYPAMLPEDKDVDDPNGAIASQARMFSEQLKRVKGRVRPKRIIILGINQLRLKPMSMGNPEYEPCGEALKLFSDVRLKHASRAISSAPYITAAMLAKAKKNGGIETEKSVQHKGEDSYRYINVRAHKNKLSRPYLEAWLRLWITNPKGEAQGFDPVFDTYAYMKQTGQMLGKRDKMKISLVHGKGRLEATKFMDWHEFKTLILGTKAEIKEICTEIGLKPMFIRDFCFKQMASGLGIDLFNTANSADDEDDGEIHDSEADDE